MTVSNHGIIGKVIDTLGRKWVRLGSTLGLLLVVGFVIGSPVRQAVVDIQLYLRLQREQLSKTPGGQRYIDVFNFQQVEILSVLKADPALMNEGLSVLHLWEPNLRALLDGKGGQAIIQKQQVQAVTRFLDHLSAKASPGLQQVIATERARTPLESLAGLSMDQAYERLIGYSPSYVMALTPTPVLTYSVTWLPPFPFQALYIVKVGTTIPVEFTVRDSAGRDVIDNSITLEINSSKGHIGTIRVGDDPATTITLHGSTYHYDLQTTGLQTGSYSLLVKSGPNGLVSVGGKGFYLSPANPPTYLSTYTVTWLPPLDPAVPYEVEMRPTIPLEFAIHDAQGRPVIDPSVILLFLRPGDMGVIGGEGSCDNTHRVCGLTLQGDTYRYDFRTDGIAIAAGSFFIQVAIDSPDPAWRVGLPVQIILKPVPNQLTP